MVSHPTASPQIFKKFKAPRHLWVLDHPEQSELQQTRRQNNQQRERPTKKSPMA